MTEGTTLDKKSLRILALDPDNWDYKEIAKDCVAFANARGGVIYFGIEDSAEEPPADQIIPEHLCDSIVKGMHHHTTNVAVSAEVQAFSNGGQVLALKISPSQRTLAATTKHQYYIRVADETRTIPPDEMVRLIADKDAYQWESQVSLRIPVDRADAEKITRLCRDLVASERVKKSVKQLPFAELLERYLLVREGSLTHLGEAHATN